MSRVEFVSRLPQVKSAIRHQLVRNLEAAIRVWHGSLVRQMAGQRTGRVYRVPGTRARYTASAPGESPAVRTGVLRASYRTEVSRTALEAYLGSDLDYSLWLERGTPNMEPRPALQPALRAQRERIAAEMSRGVPDAS
jgi:Bacteriophage protein of unknown function (DUF646).